MIKILELAVRAAENVMKAVTSSTEVVAVKAAVTSMEESGKLDTKALATQTDHHKAVKKQLDKLFD